MSDLIERQAAIDALKEHRALYCDNTPNTFSKLSYAEKSRVDELDAAIAALVNLPSVQPDRKKGKWENTRPDAPMFGFYYCSLCGRKRTSPRDRYCPNCGARMDGGRRENEPQL